MATEPNVTNAAGPAMDASSEPSTAPVTAPPPPPEATNAEVAEPALFTLAHHKRFWVNRSLRMDQVEWVGFDMDYTLAIYKQIEIDRLSVQATVKKLVERGYPPELAEARYEYDFPVRGLHIDKRYGHLLKMDRYKYVGKAYHGTRELTREERRDLYATRKIRVESERYHWIDTLYALPEAALYAGAVDLLDGRGDAVDYAQLFKDIRECIDEAHRDGAIVDVIRHNLERFVERDPELPAALHKLRSAGKKLFLLTNSRWDYTDAMMTYLLDGQLGEYGSWRQYFDIVVVAATKPAFFTEKRPFLEIAGDNRVRATRLERSRVYENGNLADFERMIKCGGDAVLYVGDHIYGDVLHAKKESAWRTAMIVQEMEIESRGLEKSRDDIRELESQSRMRDRFEDELRFRQGRFKSIEKALSEATEGSAEAAALSTERLREKRAIEEIRVKLKELDEQYRALSRKVDQSFHRWWGSIFKQGVELSSFGDQVEEYACLYTSRVSNLLSYSPLHYFRSPRDFMPHEMG